VSKQEFFKYFHTIYVSASDMTAFITDTDVGVGGVGYASNY
jgi:hypothetical protein